MDDENPSGQQRRTGDDHLSLPVVDAEGIARARHALGDQLSAWGLQESEGAVLVFSELVTNAVVHAGGAVDASVTREGPCVRIDVEDRGSGVVGVRNPGTAPGGLGLRIVSRLSDRWGTEPRPGGKVVWAVVPCSAEGDRSTEVEREAGSPPGADPTAGGAPPAGGGQPPDDEHALEPLHRLVGTWATAATHPDTGALRVLGSVEVSWLEGERFLLHRSRSDHPDFPDALLVMGMVAQVGSGTIDADGEQAVFEAHCFDSRGVVRVYDMQLDDAAWRLWWEEPGLAQRFTGSFGDRGDTIAGQWELCHDGSHWSDDLRITYTRQT